MTLQDGEKLTYSQLVLAMGADPIRLPLEGEGAEDILSVNDLDDYQRLRDALEEKKDGALEKWFNARLSSYFIKIDKDYAE